MNTKDKKLAYELAKTLDDTDALNIYQGFVEKYKKAFLSEVLAKVMSVPEHKIKRSRGALFTYLLNQHARTKDDTRD
jgi:hypothetical protein